MYLFPNVIQTLRDVLEGASTSDGRTLTTFEWLTTDFADHLPAVHVIAEDGEVSGVFRRDRIGIHVYDEAGKARAVAEEIRAALTDHPHAVGDSLLDRVTVAAVPRNLPYPSDLIDQCVASYDVDTRPLPQQ